MRKLPFVNFTYNKYVLSKCIIFKCYLYEASQDRSPPHPSSWNLGHSIPVFRLHTPNGSHHIKSESHNAKFEGRPKESGENRGGGKEREGRQLGGGVHRLQHFSVRYTEWFSGFSQMSCGGPVPTHLAICFWCARTLHLALAACTALPSLWEGGEGVLFVYVLHT